MNYLINKYFVEGTMDDLLHELAKRDIQTDIQPKEAKKK